MQKVLFCILVLAFLVVNAGARADVATPLNAGESSARTHFANGVKLYDAAPPDYVGALAEFKEAYRAKPSVGIKRNIALCLKGMHRYPDAADALEQMLSEGGDTLSAEVRAATTKAIVELNALIATVRVRIVPHTTHAPPTTVTLLVDDEEVPKAKFAQPLRVSAGEHVFKVQAAGFIEGQKRATLVGGERDVLVEIEIVALEIVQNGRLVVHANVSTATISIDGVALGVEKWAGELREGMHRIDVVAQGFPPYSVMVAVRAKEARDLSVDMSAALGPGAPTGEPSPYDVRRPIVPREYIWYFAAGLGLQGESLHFSKALEGSKEANPEATRRRFVGGGMLTLKLGRKLTSYLDGEVIGELGGLAPTAYPSPDAPSTMAKVSLTNWALAPALRVHTPGRFRALAGVAMGLEGQTISAELGDFGATGSTTKTVGGSATAGMVLLEGGAQWELGRVFLESTLFVDIHGVGGAEDASAPGKRLFLDSPAVRAGGKLVVGYSF